MIQQTSMEREAAEVANGEARLRTYALVRNIPSVLRSSDLRAFFSHTVEKGGFACFHYRHRPEHVVLTTPAATVSSEPVNTVTSIASADTKHSLNSRGDDERSELIGADGEIPIAGLGGKPVSSRCCVVAVNRGHEKEFWRRYRNRTWTKPDGELVGGKVRITRLSVSFGATIGTKRKDATGKTTNTTASIPWSELSSLLELNPPSVMPHGNVGTPTALFMQLIHQCRLPARLIKKLDLVFPKSRSKRRYGAVGLDYGTDVLEGERGEGEGEEEEGERELNSEEGRRERVEEASSEKAEEEEERIHSDDDHDAEEWERYEAFHNDVDKQERTKERLYEEEMEVVWEKGGSGLVFYTDASHWHQMEGDFDEQCSQEDDWDVCMSLYYDRDGGDRNARDLRSMAQEERIRAGENQESVFGGFEMYTKGIGSKVLKRSGWREGCGVGRSADGIAEPLETEGQHPHSRRGLGYQGEKLVRHIPRSKKRRRRGAGDVFISTVYDEVDEEKSTVSRSAPPSTIKYRQTVKFVTSNSLNSNTSSR